MYDPIFAAKKNTKGYTIELSTELEGLDIHYSFDNSHPDNFYPKYTAPLTVPIGASMLKVVTYKDGKQVGRQIDVPLSELAKRAK